MARRKLMSIPKLSVLSRALFQVSTLLLLICLLLSSRARAQSSITASPNPIVVPVGAWQGTTTIAYNAPGYSNVEVRVGSPTGALFSCCGPTGSYTTGNWVGDGAPFYLIDGNTGTVLQSVTAHLVNASITANPNPIIVSPGTSAG